MNDAPEDQPNTFSRRRPIHLVMVATLAGAMVVVGTIGYLQLSTAALDRAGASR